MSDQISISVSSGPTGRNRYDEALLYIGSTKKWGKQYPMGSFIPVASSSLRSGMSWPASRCQRTTASLKVRFQVSIAGPGSAGSSMSRRPSAICTSSAWTIPAIPSFIVCR